MRKLVSIIIPAYQEEKRIVRCLQSILASTYKNLELIIVNDGSTDNTAKVVRNFKKKNESCGASIELITIPNGGAARARNCGLQIVKGDYIGFADADDMIHPQMIERLVDSLQKGNDLAMCECLHCNEKGKPNSHQCRLHRQSVQCPHQALAMIMWEQVQMSACSVLFRRKLLLNEKNELNLFFPEDVVVFEDFVFVCEYISRCHGFMERLPFYGEFYCKHEGSLTTKRYTAKEFCHALQPILDIGEGLRDTSFIAHKLLYTFLVMEFWYKEACRSRIGEFTPNSENWKFCIQEMERYIDIYMRASNVALLKKMAILIARKYPSMGWLLAKTIGKVIF